MVVKKVLENVHAELFGGKRTAFFSDASKEEGHTAALGKVIFQINAVIEKTLTSLKIKLAKRSSHDQMNYLLCYSI